MAKMIKPVEWILGIVSLLVSLGIGFAMIGGVLPIPYIPAIVMVIAGWVVVIGVLLGLLMALVKRLS